MKILLNGKSIEINEKITVFTLLLKNGFEPNRVVVELNKKIVKQPLWDVTDIHSGDTIEVLSFVGGG
jgi:sulfur carrier protein